MSDKEILGSLIQFTETSQNLFSNAQKVEREKMVCRMLLRCIGIHFAEEEISKGSNEPVDIEFRTASFQITEILDRGRRRSDELQEAVHRFRQASCANDVLEPWKSSSPISFEDMVAVVVPRLGRKSTKLGGPRGCVGIDVLVYVNLRGRHLVSNGISDANENLARVREQGWRSASIVMLPYGIVWFATDSCPEFLTKVQGNILCDNDRADGWAEP